METQRGVYVALQVLGEAGAWLDAFIKDNGIPPVGTQKEQRRHVTLIFSRAYAPVEALPGHFYQACGKELKVFDEPDGRRCLVLVIYSPDTVHRHKQLMRTFPQLTYDFPEYVPHITLSYDIGNFDVGSLTLPVFACVLGEEYVDLNLELP